MIVQQKKLEELRVSVTIAHQELRAVIATLSFSRSKACGAQADRNWSCFKQMQVTYCSYRRLQPQGHGPALTGAEGAKSAQSDRPRPVQWSGSHSYSGRVCTLPQLHSSGALARLARHQGLWQHLNSIQSQCQYPYKIQCEYTDL